MTELETEPDTIPRWLAYSIAALTFLSIGVTVIGGAIVTYLIQRGERPPGVSRSEWIAFVQDPMGFLASGLTHLAPEWVMGWPGLALALGIPTVLYLAFAKHGGMTEDGDGHD